MCVSKFKTKYDIKVHIKAKHEKHLNMLCFNVDLKIRFNFEFEHTRITMWILLEKLYFQEIFEVSCHMIKNHMHLLRLSPCNVFLTKFTLNPVKHIRPWFPHHLNHFPSYAFKACDSHKVLLMEAFVTRNAGTNYDWVFFCICHAQLIMWVNMLV